MGISEALFGTVQQTFSQVALAQSGAFVSFGLPLVTVGLSIYITIIGIQIARGAISSPIQDFVWRIARMVIICTVLTGAGVYSGQVVGFFEGLRDGLISSISGQTNVFAAIDSIGDMLFDQGKIQAKEGSESIFPDVGKWLAAGLYFFAKVLLTITCAFPAILAYAWFYIAMALGWLAIACLLFPPTAKYFESWLGVVITSMMTQVALTLIMAMISTLLTGFMARASGNGNYLEAALNTLIVFAILCYVAWKSSELAGALAGGSGASNPFGMNPLKSAASAAGSTARGGHKAAKWIASKLGGNKINQS